MKKNITSPKFDGMVVYALFWGYLFFQVIPCLQLVIMGLK